jgi:toxin ParE1/3/4
VKRLVIRQEAEIEFAEAVGYYNSCSAGLGIDFAHEVEACFSSIQSSPKRFSFYRRTPTQRCIVHRFPYIIFFRESEDHISVIAIAHAKRKPDYWIKRGVE